MRTAISRSHSKWSLDVPTKREHTVLVMEIPLLKSFDEIKAQFPKAVAECIAVAERKGYHVIAEDWSWRLVWCIAIDPSFKRDDSSVEGKLNYIKQYASVNLQGKSGPRRYHYSEPLSEVPPQILEHYRSMYEREIVDKKAFNALSPEEKQAELSKSPGFCAFSIRQ